MSYQLKELSNNAYEVMEQIPPAKKELENRTSDVMEQNPPAKKVLANSKKQDSVKMWTGAAGIIAILSFWIFLSVNNNNLFLREAIVCSLVILFLSIIRGTDQYNKPEINS